MVRSRPASWKSALAGIRDRLLTPEIVRCFAANLQTELEQLHHANHGDCHRGKVELPETRKRIAERVVWMEEDDDPPRVIILQIRELEASEARLAIVLADPPEPTVVPPRANREAVFRRVVVELKT